jgi:ribonuclease P protein component
VNFFPGARAAEIEKGNPDNRVKRKFRLTKSTDFERVRRFGKSYAHPLIVLIALPNEDESTHFGVAAGRTVGKAVQRNRAKRLIRAALQSYLGRVNPGWDVVLLARKPMAGAAFLPTRTALEVLLNRARLLKVRNDDGTTSGA